MGKIIEGINQNTPEWLEWRKDKIGASLAPIIMGVSKWCTPWQLYMRKLGLIQEQTDNHAMARGREKESSCLEYINRSFGTNMIPVVMGHDKYPWMIASLDGWDAEKRVGCEIKCAGKEDHEKASVFGMVPEHYKPQTQHQIEVIGEDFKFFYGSFNASGHSILEVHRDDDYIKDMIDKELGFMRRFKELDPPELCDRDYVDNNSPRWVSATASYRDADMRYKNADMEREHWRNELIRLSGDHNCKGAGMRVTKSVRKGNIQYSEIPGIENLDCEKYRKPPITTWRISQE